eukprot:COSAG01_NODE_6240_length_3774_cov_1.522449_2_plen_149_part_00
MCFPPLGVHEPPCWQGELSHPVGCSQVPPDQPLWQLQVWLPPLATQLPWPQLGLPSHPVGVPQAAPFQPLLQLQLQGAYFDDWLPCCPQFFVHGGGGGGGGSCAPAHPAHSPTDTTVNANARGITPHGNAAGQRGARLRTGAVGYGYW